MHLQKMQPIFFCCQVDKYSTKGAFHNYVDIILPFLDHIKGVSKVSERFFKNGCGIQMSQATPTKFSMLFKLADRMRMHANERSF